MHPGWLIGTTPTWDLAISYFGDDTRKTFDAAAYVHRYKGGKWDGLYHFFAAYPDAVSNYDYFWLPDDDICTNAQTVNDLFRYMAEYKLELAQPALTPDSYFQHPITLANPRFDLRCSTMIEIMAPVLDRRLLALLLPIFSTTKSGFGLDYVWHRLTTDPSRKAAILDRLQVKHTRPIGSSLAKTLAAMSVDAEKEREILTSRLSVKDYHAVAFAGMLRDGTKISSRHYCALVQFLGLIGPFSRSRWQGQDHHSLIWKYYKLVRYSLSQIWHTPDISRLKLDNSNFDHAKVVGTGHDIPRDRAGCHVSG